MRAIDRCLDNIDKHIMTEVRKRVDYRKENPYMDSLRDIVAHIGKLQSIFEKHPSIERLEKDTGNIIESVHNFSSKITKAHVRSKISKGLAKIGIGIKAPDEKMFQLPNLPRGHVKPIVQNNVTLIKKQAKEYVAKIQQNIIQSIKNGESQSDLADRLQKATKVERNKAKFWASDQLGKAFSDINERNARAAGFDEYIWRTQLDGRVRDKHASFEGKKYHYDDPPLSDSGEPINPGDDYNCRCFPEIVLPETPQDNPSDRLAAQIKMRKEKKKIEEKDSKNSGQLMLDYLGQA